MPTFSKAQLDTIPLLVNERIDIVKKWFYEGAKPGDAFLFENTFNTIQKFMKPVYDPDPSSVHRCVGSVKYHLTQAITNHNSQLPMQKNAIFIAHLVKLVSLVNLDKLYVSLKEMTSKDPKFDEIEKLQLAEEKTDLFKGFKHEYLGPEDRNIATTEEKSQLRP
jgi:hypothetical protein